MQRTQKRSRLRTAGLRGPGPQAWGSDPLLGALGWRPGRRGPRGPRRGLGASPAAAAATVGAECRRRAVKVTTQTSSSIFDLLPVLPDRSNTGRRARGFTGSVSQDTERCRADLGAGSCNRNTTAFYLDNF